MDWMCTNGTTISDWSKRTLPTSNTQANEAGGDIVAVAPYFNVNGKASGNLDQMVSSLTQCAIETGTWYQADLKIAKVTRHELLHICRIDSIVPLW
jgi:hypothetical protein